MTVTIARNDTGHPPGKLADAELHFAEGPAASMKVDQEDLLTPAEVSRLADGTVTPAAVRLWADQGRLPVVRTPSGRRLFRRADVLHHLADRQIHGRTAGRRRG